MTAWDETTFPNIVRYIEQGEIQPVLAETFPLTSIAEAKKKFLEKSTWVSLYSYLSQRSDSIG